MVPPREGGGARSGGPAARRGAQDQPQDHRPEGREADLEIHREAEGEGVGRDPEPEQGPEGRRHAFEAAATEDEVVLQPVEQHHLGPEEGVREGREGKGLAHARPQEPRQDVVLQQGLGEAPHADEPGLDYEAQQSPGHHLRQEFGRGTGQGRAAGPQAGGHQFAQGAQEAELERGGKEGVGLDPEPVGVHA